MDPARLTGAGQPDFVVVTGLSGSGKSQAVKVLEDLGYYTLDNLPPALMASALDVSRKGGKQKVALVIDARSGPLFADAKKELDALEQAGTPIHLLFFDASDDVLLRRYSETRHRHPVGQVDDPRLRAYEFRDLYRTTDGRDPLATYRDCLDFRLSVVERDYFSTA